MMPDNTVVHMFFIFCFVINMYAVKNLMYTLNIRFCCNCQNKHAGEMHKGKSVSLIYCTCLVGKVT